jgi:hypothetical protein
MLIRNHHKRLRRRRYMLNEFPSILRHPSSWMDLAFQLGYFKGSDLPVLVLLPAFAPIA